MQTLDHRIKAVPRINENSRGKGYLRPKSLGNFHLISICYLSEAEARAGPRARPYRLHLKPNFWPGGVSLASLISGRHAGFVGFANHQLDATVLLSSGAGVVVGNGIGFAVASDGQTRAVDAVGGQRGGH